MNHSTGSNEKRPFGPEDLYGVYINFAGGDEDTTVRPTSVPLPPKDQRDEWYLSDRKRPFGPEDLYGVHINLAGGDEDTTVRPTSVPLPLLDGQDQQQSPESKPRVCSS
jgi:hypothetical protein